jgi:hypothetical protein
MPDPRANLGGRRRTTAAIGRGTVLNDPARMIEIYGSVSVS